MILMKMNYSVVVEPAVGYMIKQKSVKTKKEAIELAKEWSHEYANNHEVGVYITFFREQDGQHGYINPDGADLSGKDWSDSGN